MNAICSFIGIYFNAKNRPHITMTKEEAKVSHIILWSVGDYVHVQPGIVYRLSTAPSAGGLNQPQFDSFRNFYISPEMPLYPTEINC